MTAEALNRVSPLSPCGRGVGGEGCGAVRRLFITHTFITRLTARTPHPALRVTFSRKGRRGGRSHRLIRLAHDARKPRRSARPSSLTLISTVLGIATFGSPSFAKENVDCATVVNAAALQAIAKTNPLGQTFVYGQPFAVEPNVLRVEVEVFGAPDLLSSVDLTVDGACDVLSTSTRHKSNPWRDR